MVTLYLMLGACYGQGGEGYYDEGIKYGIQGKFEEAQGAFKKATEVSQPYRPAKKCLDLTTDILNGKVKREVAVLLFKGIDYANKGMLDDASGILEKAITIDPNCAESYENLGAVYGRKGMFDEAAGMFEKAIAINPGYAEAHYDLGLCYYNKKMLDNAIDKFKKCIEFQADYAEAHRDLAISYYYEGKYDLAIEHCDIAVKLGCQVDPRFLKALEPYRGTAKNN